MMCARAVEDFLESVGLRQVRDRLRRVRIRKPDAIADAKPGMAIERNAEAPRQQLLFDDSADGKVLRLHRSLRRTTVPGQGGADPLAADQKGHVFDGAD